METLVNLVEITGGLSVFISLIFLAIQIRLSEVRGVQNPLNEWVVPAGGLEPPRP